MSAEIIQFVPRPNPNRENKILDELHRQAIEIFNIGLIGSPPDTAPSEMNPAPPDDPA